MEQLADLGDGFYAYVDTFGEAVELFGENLVTTLTSSPRRRAPRWSFDPEAGRRRTG